VLQGIEDADWPKISQIVLEVDLNEHLAPITALLKKHGYEYVIEQDALLDGTELCYIYAIRPSSGRRLVRRQTTDEHLRKLPVFSGTFLSAAELRQQLLRRLPDYMIPSAFVLMDSIPLTPNGKVDRKALPVPESGRADMEESFVAPNTPIEEMLAGIWCDVLGLKAVGIHDNFFELGGHSLLATQVMSRLRNAFKVEMPLKSLFEKPTIAGLAIGIVQSQTEVADPEEMNRLLAELEGSASDTVSESGEIEVERYE
jgi:acyl carrier protein